MRTFIAAIIIFVLLAGFGIYASKYLERTAGNLGKKTEAVEKYARAKNWTEAKSSFTDLNSSWNKSSHKWTILIDHQELDNINISMARINQYINTKYHPGLMAELAELRLLLKHIPEKEAVSLDNML